MTDVGLTNSFRKDDVTVQRTCTRSHTTGLGFILTHDSTAHILTFNWVHSPVRPAPRNPHYLNIPNSHQPFPPFKAYHALHFSIYFGHPLVFVLPVYLLRLSIELVCDVRKERVHEILFIPEIYRFEQFGLVKVFLLFFNRCGQVAVFYKDLGSW